MDSMLPMVPPPDPAYASIGLDLLSLQLRNAQYVRLLELTQGVSGALQFEGRL